jgi:hypothetical protein
MAGKTFQRGGRSALALALASMIMMMEEDKIYNWDTYIMYADFKGAGNAEDHFITFKHMRQLGMTPTFVDTCEQVNNSIASLPPITTPPTAPPCLSTLTEALCMKTPSPPSFSPSSSNLSSAGSRSAVEATAPVLPPLTLTQ